MVVCRVIVENMQRRVGAEVDTDALGRFRVRRGVVLRGLRCGERLAVEQGADGGGGGGGGEGEDDTAEGRERGEGVEVTVYVGGDRVVDELVEVGQSV